MNKTEKKLNIYQWLNIRSTFRSKLQESYKPLVDYKWMKLKLHIRNEIAIFFFVERSQIPFFCCCTDLVSKVYTKKQRQVVLHVLPLLWHLIGVNNNGRGVASGSTPLRTATINLVHSLYSYMGDSLLDHAQSNPAVSSKHIQILQELIDQI